MLFFLCFDSETQNGPKRYFTLKASKVSHSFSTKNKCIEFSFADWVANVNISTNYLFTYLFVYPSMGDNLLLMDSPAPGLKSSGVAARHANKNLTSTQTESPCGVDKLLNFSPSKLNEVNLR